MVVDADGAELVDQHGAVGERRVAQQPVEQARFSRPEKARQHVDRQPAVHQPPPPPSCSPPNPPPPPSPSPPPPVFGPPATPAPPGGGSTPLPAGGRFSPPPTGGRLSHPCSSGSIATPPSRSSASPTRASDGTSSCLPVAPATRYAQPCQSLICTLRVRAMRLSIRTMRARSARAVAGMASRSRPCALLQCAGSPRTPHMPHIGRAGSVRAPGPVGAARNRRPFHRA